MQLHALQYSSFCWLPVWLGSGAPSSVSDYPPWEDSGFITEYFEYSAFLARRFEKLGDARRDDLSCFAALFFEQLQGWGPWGIQMGALLRTLHLQRNNLDSLPASIGNLTKLEQLDFTHRCYSWLLPKDVSSFKLCLGLVWTTGSRCPFRCLFPTAWPFAFPHSFPCGWPRYGCWIA